MLLIILEFYELIFKFFIWHLNIQLTAHCASVQGLTNTTKRYTARDDPNRLTSDIVNLMAGPKIADFCRDYYTYLRRLIPAPEVQKRGINTFHFHRNRLCILLSIVSIKLIGYLGSFECTAKNLMYFNTKSTHHPSLIFILDVVILRVRQSFIF